MADKNMKVTLRDGKVSYSPGTVTISIDRQDDVILQSSVPLRVTRVQRVGKKRGSATGPFFRPFPRRGDPFRKRVNSGPAREGTRGRYKLSLLFENGVKDDPIVIIDQ
jgi:hypothetical protein